MQNNHTNSSHHFCHRKNIAFLIEFRFILFHIRAYVFFLLSFGHVVMNCTVECLINVLHVMNLQSLFSVDDIVVKIIRQTKLTEAKNRDCMVIMIINLHIFCKQNIHNKHLRISRILLVASCLSGVKKKT